MSESFQIIRRTFSGDINLFQGIDPLLARVLIQRGINTQQEIELDTRGLIPFDSLKNIQPAVELLTQALQQQWRILIVGDYDVDGATSSALLIRAFTMFGLKQIRYLVPNRFSDGYGLSENLVLCDETMRFAPDLLITVDNGISSIEGVAAAKMAGMKVLVTDHHIAADELPDADVIINPNQPGDKFPSKHLAGVGVAFYLILAWRSYLRKNNWFKEHQLVEPNITTLLDLVALGTVADVVKLDQNNRILVQQGIARIRSGSGCAGINALIEVSRRDHKTLVTQDLGFALSPRINAAGRLDDMGLGIKLLCCDDMDAARTMAIELDQLNYTRREIEADMRAEAIKTAEKIAQHLKQPPVGVTLYDPQWHQGVIGIVASRLKEKLNRPVIVMTDIGEGFIRGSARSIHGLHVRDALHQIDIAYPDLLLKYGGHAMAAGLTLHKDDLDRFSQAFDDICRDELSDEQLRCHWVSDGMLDEADVNLQQINLIKMAMPWGQGFDAPQFDGQFELCHFQWVGNGHLKMQLKWPGTTTSVDAIYFFAADHDFQPLYGMVEVVYQPDINHWRGSSQVQLRVIAIRTLD